MNCFECGYPLQAGMTCSECGCDNTKYAGVLNIETQSPGIFQRMHTGFRYVKFHAIWVLATQIVLQLLFFGANRVMTPSLWASVMDIWYWVVSAIALVGILLAFLAAWLIAPRHAPDGPLRSGLVTTIRILFGFSLCVTFLPIVAPLISFIEAPPTVETWFANIYAFMRSGWSYFLNSLAIWIAAPIFAYLCFRSAAILEAPRARGWFRVGLFFVIASFFIQLPQLVFEIMAVLPSLIGHAQPNAPSPSFYFAVLYWTGLVNTWVYLAFTAFMLMGSIRMSQHLRTLIPLQTPLHQEGGAA